MNDAAQYHLTGTQTPTTSVIEIFRQVFQAIKLNYLSSVQYVPVVRTVMPTRKN
jgi:hypothetical protein